MFCCCHLHMQVVVAQCGQDSLGCQALTTSSPNLGENIFPCPHMSERPFQIKDHILFVRQQQYGNVLVFYCCYHLHAIDFACKIKLVWRSAAKCVLAARRSPHRINDTMSIRMWWFAIPLLYNHHICSSVARQKRACYVDWIIGSTGG